MSIIDFFANVLGTPLAITDVIRAVAGILTFLYASYTDIEERRVENNVWIPVLVVAFATLAYDLFTGNPELLVPRVLANIAFLSLVSFILFKSSIFYGADFKALVVISILFPLQPLLGKFPVYTAPGNVAFSEVLNAATMTEAVSLFNVFLTTQVFGFTLLSNIAVASVFYLVWNSLHNLRNGTFTLKAPLRSVTARHMSTDELSDVHGQVVPPTTSSNPLFKGAEFIRGGLRGLHTDFFRDYLNWHTNTAEDTPSSVSNLESIRLEGFVEMSDKWETTDPEEDQEELERIISQDKVWVTPGIPFIVPITFALLMSLLIGNLVYAVIAVSLSGDLSMFTGFLSILI